MSVASLPECVKNFFPTEQLEFSSSITADEKPVLHEVFQKHSCFSQCGEMIDEVSKKHPELGKRLATVLEGNKKRLDGLSPAAVEYAKKLIHMVTTTLCSLTVGKPIDDADAKRLHQEFQSLSSEDQAALRKNNPDIKF
ncbi:Fatty Acid/Retinol binding protein [Caenorhabditis elegans]|uniref:Fatty Acid/Retinol binding protein n=3 Tax=Caenorhabditis elegans TaxID=6239 RepID=Q9TZ51_CAEEL|nr:Fatty Acid/Retinol binding protein [Caenorhabditis elegans]CCD61950.1 Fatty Acid/Retinol binding protein [Caenorhabditis elegans]|eukprot:NP_493708.1 Fatty Acid/Retinol binding protein [Caenorhabditis elegans]